MKKTAMVFAVYFCVVCGGVATINYWESLQAKPTQYARPEGYQKPTAHDRISPKAMLRLKRKGRVTKLEIAPNVPKYFDKNLELVALAPGSGWLKFRTADNITPVLSFKKVTRSDIERFNSFAKSVDSPIRVAMAGPTLHISAQETAADIAYFKDRGKSLTAEGKPKAYYYGFNKTDTAPKVVLKKDRQGNIFLVRSEDKEASAETTVAENQVAE